MRSLLTVLLVCGVGLAACGRGKPAHKAAAVPDAAINAAGEPQWSAQVRAGELRFNDGGDTALAARVERSDQGAQGVVWTGPLPAAPGRPAGVLKLTTLRKPCQDAATGMTYPLTAIAEASGRRYAGCAASPGQGLGPRQ